MIHHQTPFFLPWLYPSLTWRMGEEKKDLFLTFDDGPVEGPTEFVLDQLARFSIPATFFCIGDNIRKYPAIFSAIIAGGHTVGNHTVNHVNGWKTSAEGYLANTKGFDHIAAEAGLPRRTDLFRPPYGRITGRQIKILTDDYRIIMWDVLSQDYNQSLSPEKCLRRTLQVCRSGSIIIFHDSYRARRNMEYALPRLIEHFGGEGYHFKVIPDCATRGALSSKPSS